MSRFSILRSRRVIWAMGSLAAVLVVSGVFYVLAQSMVGQLLQTQIRRAGFPQAGVSGVRLYMDGIVIRHVDLNEQTHLTDLFTPQSGPDLARHGLQRLIIREWSQTIPDAESVRMHWPFPRLERVFIEKTRLTFKTPLRDIVIEGAVKSLQPDAETLALLMPFTVSHDDYALNGRMDMSVVRGEIASLDINLDDGFFNDDRLQMKRLSGWLNMQPDDGDVPQIKAQLLSGAVSYAGQSFSDATLQYGRSTAEPTQWTVALNRASDQYFNTWVIKPATRNRYVMQIATQAGDQTKTETMVTVAPLVLQPLLQLAQPQ